MEYQKLIFKKLKIVLQTTLQVVLEVLFIGTTTDQPMFLIKCMIPTLLVFMEMTLQVMRSHSGQSLRKSMSKLAMDQLEGKHNAWLYSYLSIRGLSYSGNQTDINLNEWQSGSVIPPIYIGLYDEFENIVKSDSSSSATLSITSVNPSDAYPDNLIGSTFVEAVNGIFIFTDLILTAEPGSNSCNTIA